MLHVLYLVSLTSTISSKPPMAFSHVINRQFMHQMKQVSCCFPTVSSRPAVLSVTALLHFTDDKKSSERLLTDILLSK